MGRETNKSRREANAASARDKAAAARALQAQADRRRRAIVILSSVVGVVVVLALIALIAINSSGSKKGSAATPANPQVVAELTGVPQTTSDAVGKGTSAASLGSISDPPLTSGGKPEFLYIGAEYCPFCAAERWSMIQALSRFGTFSNLHEIYSAEDHFPTFTFVGSSYSSKYVAFTPREIETNETPNPKPLQSLTAAQTELFKRYSPKESFPYLYLGGKYVQSGAGYDPTVLSGKTQAQVASALSDTSAATTKGILGEANVLTAGICGMTNNKPANVCTSSTISGIQGQIQPFKVSP
jgi:thiol-disulfide isomerase/thioredoxin